MESLIACYQLIRNKKQGLISCDKLKTFLIKKPNNWPIISGKYKVVAFSIDTLIEIHQSNCSINKRVKKKYINFKRLIINIFLKHNFIEKNQHSKLIISPIFEYAIYTSWRTHFKEWFMQKLYTINNLISVST